MAQEYEFQYKVATSEKKSSRPRADASGGERAWLRHAALGIRQKNGGVGQMPTEKGRFSSSGVERRGRRLLFLMAFSYGRKRRKRTEGGVVCYVKKRQLALQLASMAACTRPFSLRPDAH